MKFRFLLVFLFPTIVSNSQTVYSVIGQMYNEEKAYLYSKVDTSKCEYNGLSVISHDNNFFIIGDSSCNNGLNKWYMVFLDSQVVFAEKFYFKEVKLIDRQLSKIKSYTPELKERISNMPREIARVKQDDSIKAEKETAIAIGEEKEREKQNKKTLDSLQKLIDANLAIYRVRNWVLWKWSWSYANEYSSFTDVDIELINPFKQKIKYLWITFTATNPVGDPVRDGISRATEKTVKGVGPIEYGDHGSYQFESVFYSKVIESMQIKQIKLQFFDGTFKTITKPHEVYREEND